MTFKFGEMDFSSEFPRGEAIQRKWPNVSGLSIQSLEIPRMEHRRFLEPTRPRTQIVYDVILHGDSSDEVEERRQTFMKYVDPSLGPQKLIQDDDPDWYWEMAVSSEILWERLTWGCESGGFRLRSQVVFESYNDAAKRLVNEKLFSVIDESSLYNYAPAISGSGSWSVVRSNLSRYPREGRASQSTLQNHTKGVIQSSGGPEHCPRWFRADVTTEYSGTTAFLRFDTYTRNSANPIEGGKTYYIRASTYSEKNRERVLSVYYYDQTGGSLGNSSLVYPAGVGWVENVRVIEAPEATMYLSVAAGVEATVPFTVGETVGFAGFMISDKPGPYFDGSSPNGSVDPDMRTRWTGSPDDSTSVLEIEQVRGYTPVNCVAGLSSRGGNPAIRLIPTSDSKLSYARVDIPNGVSSGGSVISTLQLDNPLSGTLNSDALSVRAHPTDKAATAPNKAGSYSLNISELDGGNELRLYHGGSSGSGDVYWSDIAMYNVPYSPPGGNDGPIASGNTRTWPTVRITGTLSKTQEVEVIIDDFKVRVSGPLAARDVMVLDYLKMRFEVYREGVKIASLVPRMSTLDRVEIRPQNGPIYFTASPVTGGSVNSATLIPNSRKQ